MESSFRTLQSQLDKSNRKISTAETILKNITQERDSAISQLGVAYFTIEQLKVENAGLKDENNKLKTRLGQLTSDPENETQQWTIKEEALRRKLDRRTETVRSMKEDGVQPPELQDKAASKDWHIKGIEPNPEPSAYKNLNTMFDLLSGRKDIDEPSKGGQRSVQIDDSQDSEDSMYEAPEGKGEGKGKGKGKGDNWSPRIAKNVPGDETSQNVTYLSFLEVKSPLMLGLQLLILLFIER